MAELLDPGRRGRRGDADGVREQIGQRKASPQNALRQFNQYAETQGRQGEVRPALTRRDCKGEKRDNVEGHHMRGRVAQTELRLQTLERTERKHQKGADGGNGDGP